MNYHDPSRRELLKALAGAAAILPAGSLVAQTKKAGPGESTCTIICCRRFSPT